MGIAIWSAASIAALVLARLIRGGRPSTLMIEFAIAMVTAAALGLTATTLDFGGWKEPDWRAGLLVFFGSLATIALGRVIRLLRLAKTKIV